MNCSLISTGLLIFMAVALARVNALTCWRCTSDVHPDVCIDKFNASLVTEEQKSWAYWTCATPPQHGVFKFARPVCTKIKHQIDGVSVVTRNCGYEHINKPGESCDKSSVSWIDVESCETCLEDGCNGI